MIVKNVFNVKGRGTMVVAYITNNEIAYIGDYLICGQLKWQLHGIEMTSPSPKDGSVGFVVRGIDHSQMPKAGDVLVIERKNECKDNK